MWKRIAAFEQAAADAVNPERMAAKISFRSDRKKYDFADGLRRDLLATRAALRHCCCCSVAARSRTITSSRRSSSTSCCTFQHLFKYTDGHIANLNRVLQNLKNANEVTFSPECFFIGVNCHEKIRLLDKFWNEEYMVNAENVFRWTNTTTDARLLSHKGRSYVEENRQTMRVHHCASCHQHVGAYDRLAIRDKVFHLKCLRCIVCGASPSQKMDYLTFDGEICCGSDCIRRYDGAHVHQQRN